MTLVAIPSATELPEAEPGVPQPVLDILDDITLSMGEKVLLLEGLFVHDSSPGPDLGRSGRALGPPPRRWAEASFMRT